MKKIILLTGISTAILAANANALEYGQYMSLKAALSKIQNETTAISDYSFGGTTHHTNTLSDKTHKDNVWGVRAAYGLMTPVKYGKLRGEIELGANDKAKENNQFDFTITNTYRHNFEIETTVYSAMFNLYYDIDTGTKFTPYIGGGVGYARVKSKAKVYGSTPYGDINMSSTSHDNNFAWQLGFGVSYAVNDKWDIDLGYRYSDYGNAKDSIASSIIPGLDSVLYADADYSITSHEIMLGVRYSF